MAAKAGGANDRGQELAAARGNRGHGIVTNLKAIEEAMAEFTDIELRALIVASNEVPRIAPGLLSWIEGACVWEINRRRGFDAYRLQPLEAAIDQSQEVACMKGTFAMQASFATGAMAPASLKLFHALMDLLTGIRTERALSEL